MMRKYVEWALLTLNIVMVTFYVLLYIGTNRGPAAVSLILCDGPLFGFLIMLMGDRYRI